MEEAKCNTEQYDMIIKCSKKNDITEWNNWVENHCTKFGTEEKILLDGSNFVNINLNNIFFGGANIREAFFNHTQLENANCNGTHLDESIFANTNLKNTQFSKARLARSEFNEVYAESACFNKARLQNAKLINSNLQKAVFTRAELNHADFDNSHLEGATFDGASLEGAKFVRAFVDSSSSFFYCSIDKQTDFRDINLDVIRIDQGTKQLLEYNGRRMNWIDWYKKHCVLRWPVSFFWWLSDYGRSTGRILSSFFLLSLIFAIVYFCCEQYSYPGIISGLSGNCTEGAVQGADLLLLRSLYFSIVTMTTLGFGDIYANPYSYWGHILLIMQVLLGYVLLGALITRLAILFTVGGPAGKFSNITKPITIETKVVHRKINF